MGRKTTPQSKDSKMLGLILIILSTPMATIPPGNHRLLKDIESITTSVEDLPTSTFLLAIFQENFRTITSCSPNLSGISKLKLAS